jgi:hypothetical protein
VLRCYDEAGRLVLEKLAAGVVGRYINGFKIPLTAAKIY